MAFRTRIWLLSLVLVAAAIAVGCAHTARSSVTRPQAMRMLQSPARFTGPVPLAPLPAPRPKAPTLAVRAVAIAQGEIGVPYRYGGNSPAGFDCSGLVAYVYGRLGIALPHNAAAQYDYGRPVDRRHLRPGDLVFFHGLGHVGLYIGRDRIIHAPRAGKRVEIQALSARSGEIQGARRLTF